jgi:hypothetical protein
MSLPRPSEGSKRTKDKFMTILLLLISFALTSCGQQSGVTPVGGGFGFINLGNPGVTRMDAWYAAPTQYQISHVHKIVQALGDNGMRCNRPGVTVGHIRTELMTRANAGKYQPEDKLFDKTVDVIKDVCD